ncbi:MAG: ubiquinone biosynthesis protein UbiH, partial [Deltaproteobacteria bacterium]|nr:ubiquinone biosynthesis protein UbiH [Deltaproteobacteria bacterium]
GLLFLVSLWLAVRLAALLLRPLRRLTAGNRERARQSLLGRVVTIRSGTANHRSGQAVCEGYGADLILEVRSRRTEQTFARGEKAVILRYDAAGHQYIIISEDEFRAR